MSWLDKIKSILARKEKKIEIEAPARVINFEDIPGLLEEKTKKLKENNARIKDRIINRIKEFGTALNGVISALENLDLGKRKEDERLKLIVRENSNQYASLVLRLSSKLNGIAKNGDGREDGKRGEGEKNGEIGESGARGLLEKIALNLSEFYRTSALPFQKGTILIGKEMENIKTIIRGFSDEMTAIEKENESFFKENELVRAMNNHFLELKELGKQEEILNHLLEEQKRKIESMNKDYIAIEKEIEEIRKSENYKKDMEEREGKEKERKEIEKKFQELKTEIDFKELGKKYHSIEKLHKIVKKYSNNFVWALMEDKELEFGNLLMDENQKEQLRELKSKLIELAKEISTKTEERIKSLLDTQKDIKNELKNMESNIENTGKRMRKLVDRKNNLKEEIKSLAKKAGV